MKPGMIKHIPTGFYFGFWAAIAAGIIYVAMSAGYSFPVSFALAFLLFIFLNGSLSYAFRARQLRREGKRPPPYLIYLFFPKGVRTAMVVPRPIRIGLGIVISLGGIFFLFVSGLLITHFDSLRTTGVYLAIMLLLISVIFGVAFVYIGYRLFVMKDYERLFKRG